jgi:hypothetical protein
MRLEVESLTPEDRERVCAEAVFWKAEIVINAPKATTPNALTSLFVRCRELR